MDPALKSGMEISKKLKNLGLKVNRGLEDFIQLYLKKSMNS